MEYEQSRREFFRHSLVGGSSTDVVEHEVYTIHLSDINNSYRCAFEALGQPLICGSIPPVCPRSFLEGSEELDVSDLMRDRIEVLIGANFAGRLLIDDQRRISSGLVAIRTKLGWTVMGKIPPTEVRDDTSSLCVTTLLSLDLENLWKLDAIGVSDAEVEKKNQSLQAEMEEHFAHTTTRDIEERYEVALPWVQYKERIPTNRDLAENQLNLDLIDNQTLSRKYQYIKRVREDIRERFRIEYFGILRQETRRLKTTIPFKVRDMVLIGQESLKRLHWPLARIIQLYPGKDGFVRVAKKFSTSDLTSSRQCSKQQATNNFTEATSFYKLYLERLPRQQENNQRPSFLTEQSSHNCHRKRRQFKQTDAFTRGMVIGLKRAGWSIRQIAADTHLGASTVHRLWRRWLEQGNVAIYRNVGATRVTSARVDRRILRQAVAAPQATCTAILQHVQDTHLDQNHFPSIGSCSQMSRVSACPVIVAVYACGVDVEKGPIRQQLWNPHRATTWNRGLGRNRV
ncbi:hypothetical protein LAZ67_8001159 [Cordylochernes scorpioides]|uniref:DUF5641 domain-containing protein n=1 Tax=Cordylochernes scorpioides TaxID=51811 RepID=A0ABY6KT71_9ARAC|nr:hypothetical protein LAZ67_8001159 [Cordylochernes scorpioides]